MAAIKVVAINWHAELPHSGAKRRCFIHTTWCLEMSSTISGHPFNEAEEAALMLMLADKLGT
ncbi:hypothetical protein MJ579_29190 [Klebsiella pneumoniae]|nr:hypothetical protein MJ579_29190 [Klebsiella pneumoniae]